MNDMKKLLTILVLLFTVCTLYIKAEVVYSGDAHNVKSWSAKQLPVTDFPILAKANAGDVIAISVTSVEEGARICLQDTGWQGFADEYNCTAGIHYFILTETDAATVKANGLIVTGEKYSFDKVELLYKKTLWTGEIDDNAGWAQSDIIPNTTFTSLSAGSLLGITISKINDGMTWHQYAIRKNYETNIFSGTPTNVTTSVHTLTTENISDLTTQNIDIAAQYLCVSELCTYLAELSSPTTQYTLTITQPDGGKIQIEGEDAAASQEYDENTQVTLTPVAKSNWLFSKWMSGETELTAESDNTLILTMTEHKSVTAVFTVIDAKILDWAHEYTSNTDYDLSTAAVGDKVRITYSKTSNEGGDMYLKVSAKSDTWAYDPTFHDGTITETTYDIDVTAENQANITARGLFLQGSNITITNIEVISAKTTQTLKTATQKMVNETVGTKVLIANTAFENASIGDVITVNMSEVATSGAFIVLKENADGHSFFGDDNSSPLTSGQTSFTHTLTASDITLLDGDNNALCITGEGFTCGNITITSAGSITADAAHTTMYVLSVSQPAEGGAIQIGDADAEAQKAYDNGTQVTLTAVPASGYIFSKWMKDGSETGSAESLNVTFDGTDIAVTAEFIANPRILTGSNEYSTGNTLFSSLELGDKIRVNFTKTDENDTEYTPSIEVRLTSGDTNSKLSGNFNSSTDAEKNLYEIKITGESALTSIKSNGLFIAGNDITIGDITVIPAKQLTWFSEYEIPASDFSAIEVGGKINLAFTRGTSPNLQIVCPTTDSWTYLKNEGLTEDTYSYDVTADNCEPIKAKGLRLKGQDLTYSSVSIVDAPTYQVSVTATNGKIYIGDTETEYTNNTRYKTGSSVSLRALANEGYRFVNWTNGTDEVSTDATYTIASISSDATLTVNFIQQFTVTASSADEGKGYVAITDADENNKYDAGSTVTITATPTNASYEFEKWTKTGDADWNASESATTNPLSIADLNGNWTLTASFKEKTKDTPEISLSSFTANDGATLADGVFTTTADNKTIGQWIGDNSGVMGNKLVVKFAGAPTGGEDQSIKVAAEYIADTYTEAYAYADANNVAVVELDNTKYIKTVYIQLTKAGSVTINSIALDPLYTITATSADANKGTAAVTTDPTSAGKYAYGTEVTVMAAPKSGYSFFQWKVGDNSVSTDDSYTFTATEDIALTAEFKVARTSKTLKQVSKVMRGEDFNTVVTVDASSFTKASEGDVITVNMSGVAESDAVITLKENGGDYAVYTVNYAENLTSGQTAYTLDITSEILTRLQGNGLFITGSGFTCGNIMISSAGEITEDTGDNPAEKFTLTITAPENGTMTVKDGETELATGAKVTEGTNLTLTATANSSYDFSKWQKDGADLEDTNNPTTIAMPSADMSLTAVFTATPSINEGEEEPDASTVDATSVFSTQTALGNWNVDDIQITASSFANVKADDYIKVYLSSTIPTSTFALQNLGTWQNLTDFETVVPGEGATKYIYKITTETLVELQESGLVIKGQNCTVDKVELLTIKSNIGIWEGSTTLDWGADPGVSISLAADKFANAQVGNILKIEGTADNGIQVKVCVNYPWKESDKYTSLPISYTIADTDLDNIKANGMTIAGQNTTITKVSLITEAEPDPEITYPITVWTGEKVFGSSWDEWEKIPASAFSNATTGKYLRVKFKDLKAGAQLKLSKSDWEIMPDAEIANISGTYQQYTITDGMLAELKSGGMIVSGIGYTMTGIEILDPAQLKTLTLSVPVTNSWVYSGAPSFTIHVENPYSETVTANAVIDIATDELSPVTSITKSVDIAANGSQDIEMTCAESLAAGIYKATATINDDLARAFFFAVNPTSIVSAPDKQSDFDSYWTEAKDQLAAIEAKDEPVLTEITSKSTDKRKVYLVEFKSVPDGISGEPVTVRGYYAEPTDGKKHPVIMHYQGYDSGMGPGGSKPAVYVPYGDGDTSDYAEFVLSTRGQVVNNRKAAERGDGIDRDFENTYGDWFAFNFGQKDSYYYRGAYMDLLRAIDFMATRSTSDMDNLFAEGQSQGGAFTVAAAALSDYTFKAIAPAITFMGDFPDYFDIVSWPAYVARENQGTMTDDEMFAFLSYYDTKNLATAISCPIITSVGIQDNVCPAHTNLASYNNVTTAADKKQIVFNPELQHQVADDWFTTYMAFFETYRTESVQPSTPVFDENGKADLSKFEVQDADKVTYDTESHKITVTDGWIGVQVSATTADDVQGEELRITFSEATTVKASVKYADETATDTIMSDAATILYMVIDGTKKVSQIQIQPTEAGSVTLNEVKVNTESTKPADPVITPVFTDGVADLSQFVVQDADKVTYDATSHKITVTEGWTGVQATVTDGEEVSGKELRITFSEASKVKVAVSYTDNTSAEDVIMSDAATVCYVTLDNTKRVYQIQIQPTDAGSVTLSEVIVNAESTKPVVTPLFDENKKADLSQFVVQDANKVTYDATSHKITVTEGWTGVQATITDGEEVSGKELRITFSKTSKVKVAVSYTDNTSAEDVIMSDAATVCYVTLDNTKKVYQIQIQPTDAGSVTLSEVIVNAESTKPAPEPSDEGEDEETIIDEKTGEADLTELAAQDATKTTLTQNEDGSITMTTTEDYCAAQIWFNDPETVTGNVLKVELAESNVNVTVTVKYTDGTESQMSANTKVFAARSFTRAITSGTTIEVPLETGKEVQNIEVKNNVAGTITIKKMQVTTINVFTDGEANLSMLKPQSNATYDTAAHTLATTKGWTGATISPVNTENVSGKELLIEFAEPSKVKVAVKYRTNEDGPSKIMDKAATSVRLALDNTKNIQEITIQPTEAAIVTFKKIAVNSEESDDGSLKPGKTITLWESATGETLAWNEVAKQDASVGEMLQGYDELLITVSGVTEGCDWPKVFIRDASSEQAGNEVLLNDIGSFPYTVRIVLTDEMAEQLEKGFSICGDGVTVTKLEVYRPEAPKTGDIHLADLNYGYNSSYDKGTHTITTTARWAARGWEIGDKRYNDKNLITVKFEAVDFPVTLKMEYTTGTQTAQATSVGVPAGRTELLLEIPKGISKLNRVYIIYENPGSVKLTEVSVTYQGKLKLSTAIQAFEAEGVIRDGRYDTDGWYNLRGMRIPEPKTSGIYIHGGKKVVKY